MLPLGNRTGTMKMLSLNTGQLVNRDQFKILPMPLSVIQRMNELALKDGRVKGKGELGQKPTTYNMQSEVSNSLPDIMETVINNGVDPSIVPRNVELNLDLVEIGMKVNSKGMGVETTSCLTVNTKGMGVRMIWIYRSTTQTTPMMPSHNLFHMEHRRMLLDYLIQLRYVYSGIVEYVVINTHMYVTRYVRTFIHIGMVTYIPTHVLTHICTYQYVCTYAYVRTHVC